MPGSVAEMMAGDPPGPETRLQNRGDKVYIQHTIAFLSLSNKEDSALYPCIALSKEGMSSEPAT